MRKRFLPLFLAILFLLMAFTSCSTLNEPETSSSENQDQTSYNTDPSETDSETSDDSTDSETDSETYSTDSDGDNSTPSGEQTDSDSDVPIDYFTSDISPEGLMAVYEALGWTPTGNVAVKLSTGEPPASNYLDPQLIKDVVEAVDGTIVECNTAYGGSRSETRKN